MKKEKDIAAVTGILWDLDNTLYASSDTVYDTFNNAVARAAIAWGIDIDFETARAMARQSFLETRFSALHFIERYDIPFPELHYLIDGFLDHTTVDTCRHTTDMFARVGGDHALITHAGRPWALNVLDRLGLRPWFPDERIFGFENYDFQSKAKSRRPFEMALSSINRNPGDVAMVEDTVENLRVPHEMGMTTILVHHGDTPADIPDFVDIHCDNAAELLKRLHSRASG